MAKSNKIRNHGAIPEKRHDAFLLALLLALVMNVSFFAVQAVMPRIAYLLQLLTPAATVQQPEEEEEALPFILVDPSLFDEPVDNNPPDAESMVNREARQAENSPILPTDKPFVEEGVEDLSTMLDGATGPEDSSYLDAPESAPSDAQEPQEAQPEDSQESPEDNPEPTESEPFEEQMPPEEVAEPTPEPVSESLRPPEPAPEPEPVEEFIPPPPMEEAPQPEPIPEPPEEIIPDPKPEPVEEVAPEPEPEEYLQPEPAPDMQDLAMLPVTPDGLYDPQRQYLEELARREDIQRREREVYEQRQRQEMLRQQEIQRLQQEEYQRRLQEQYELQQQQQQQQRQEESQPRRRDGRRQPEFRRLTPAPESAPSRRGGAPRQRNRDSRIDLLDSDPNMKYLAHKYAEYMRKVAKLLQESLNREVMLQPMGYTVGQARIIFTIAADGRLGYYRTQYPVDGSLEYVRLTSEQTLVNAGPFDPPTQEMLQDPVFKQMSLTVNLY